MKVLIAYTSVQYVLCEKYHTRNDLCSSFDCRWLCSQPRRHISPAVVSLLPALGWCVADCCGWMVSDGVRGKQRHTGALRFVCACVLGADWNVDDLLSERPQVTGE